MPEPIISVIIEEAGTGLYTQNIKASRHSLVADESVVTGGNDSGPAPYDLLLAALGSCTSMTLRMYANQKKWDLKHVTVTLTHKKEPDAENKKTDIITRDIELVGNLDDVQRQRLLEIANKCPVHRTLTELPRPVITSRLIG